MIATVTSPASALSDFPDWLGAMWVKELRQGLRRKIFLANFLLLHVVMSGWVVLMASDDNFVREAGEGFFWTLLTVGFLVIPCRAVAAINSEKKAGTFDLIRLSSLSAWQIVFGKWVALMSQVILLAVSLLPYALIRYFFGEFNLMRDGVTVAVLLGVTALLTAGGLVVSSMNRFGVILLVITSVAVAPFLLPFLIIGAVTIVGSFRTDFSAITMFAFPYFAALYSLILLNFVAFAMAGAGENSTTRIKILGWLLLLPSLVTAWFCEMDIPLLLAGFSALGVTVTIFAVLGTSPVPKPQLVAAFFRRQNFWKRKTAWLLAPQHEADMRNSAALFVMLVVAFFSPLWITRTGFLTPLATAWFYVCFFVAMLLPVVMRHVFRRINWVMNPSTLFVLSQGIFITVTMIFGTAIVHGAGRWANVVVCATPYGSLFLTALKKEILPESVTLLLLQWVMIFAVKWRCRPPKVEVEVTHE